MDVYIALRSDGAAAGSGTEADPYSGATLQNGGSAVSISLLEIVASPVSPPPVPPLTTRVKVTTSLNHNFKNNDLVLIEGVSSYFFNGTFAIA